MQHTHDAIPYLSLARSAFERAKLKKTLWPIAAKEEQREGVTCYLEARKERHQQHRSTPSAGACSEPNMRPATAPIYRKHAFDVFGAPPKS
jgi:hypothetical protein